MDNDLTPQHAAKPYLDEVPQAKPQTGYMSSDHPESNTAGEEGELRHLESQLHRFIDHRITLGSLLELGSEAFNEPIEAVAEALDDLVGRGLVRFADGIVAPAGSPELAPSKGDALLAVAQELAVRKYNAELDELPLADQSSLLDAADKELLERQKMARQADLDPLSQEPAPDPVKAPNGWEAIVGADGKTEWRSKSDPNVKLKRKEM